jgi:hypothetical protein
MRTRFGLLREALEHLSWDAPTQRRHFAGAVATDELALDLDNALMSLPTSASACPSRWNPTW